MRRSVDDIQASVTSIRLTNSVPIFMRPSTQASEMVSILISNVTGRVQNPKSLSAYKNSHLNEYRW